MGGGFQLIACQLITCGYMFSRANDTGSNGACKSSDHFWNAEKHFHTFALCSCTSGMLRRTSKGDCCCC